jgi:hypothetical protein
MCFPDDGTGEVDGEKSVGKEWGKNERTASFLIFYLVKFLVNLH